MSSPTDGITRRFTWKGSCGFALMMAVLSTSTGTSTVAVTANESSTQGITPVPPAGSLTGGTVKPLQ